MKLTPRRKAILTAIWKSNGPPSLREVGRTVGLLANSSVFYELEKLQYHGYVTWNNGHARTLALTGRGLLAAQGWRELYRVADDGSVRMADEVR